ncbi:hypothetical protein EKE94_17885 [Mesobaculum littorinae]|uniref:Porin n=1 Tax=Mesobaculum littorinae TaxID=2486419 RepID=A0A438AD47_9RHOB|nr:hypothetical protein [Mesobaculum littorinae]RVV96595.1 hypothetical protein EKE94_17885 [Mesobaculum littorinae]
MKQRVLRDAAAGGLCLSLAVVTQAARAQEFLQFDASPSDSTFVASATRGAWGAALTASSYGDGSEVNLAGTYGFTFPAFGETATLRVGPSLKKPEDEGLSLGATLAVEHYRPTDWGGLFLLGSVNTVNGGYFTLVQPNFSNGISLELTAGGDNGDYEEQAVAVTRRLGDGPWRLRAGYRVRAEEVFLGVSYNTF